MTPAVPGGDLRSPVLSRQTRLADGDAAVRRFLRSRALSLIGPELPARIRELWPDYAQATVAAAERICRNRFSLLGYEALSFGSPIDWHLDRVPPAVAHHSFTGAYRSPRRDSDGR